MSRSGRWVHLPGVVLGVGVVIAIPMAIALLKMLFGSGQYAPGTLVAYALLALLSGMIWSSRWWVDDTGVERRMPYLPRLRLAWSDVVAVRTTSTECVLVGPGKVRVRILAGWAGYGFFASMVVKHVRALDAMDEAVRKELETKARDCSEVWDHYPSFAADSAAPPEEAVRRWRENPFFVLGLPPECTSAEVERTGQKLLGLLALDVASARSYESPFGPVLRTADDVRAAMAELRDPDRRVLHEVWARLPPVDDMAFGPAFEARAYRWKDAMAALGWRRL